MFCSHGETVLFLAILPAAYNTLVLVHFIYSNLFFLSLLHQDIHHFKT